MTHLSKPALLMWHQVFYSVMLSHSCATFQRLSAYFSSHIFLSKMTNINIKLGLSRNKY